MFGSDMVSFLESKQEDVTGFNSNDLDLTSDLDVLDQAIRGFDVVINATAYTNVNLAEKEPEKAFELNAEVPEKLAKITANHNQRLIHISTDYVFDGTKGSPYLTSDEPNPLNVYGESKLAGELAILETDPNALVIRTSWLYGPNGPCFPMAILEKAKNSVPLEVVDDQFGTPTSTWFLSDFCYRAIEQNLPGGLHHGVPNGFASWFDFAELITNKTVHIRRAKTINGHAVAKRPANSQLEPSPKTEKTWLETWEAAKTGFEQPLI